MATLILEPEFYVDEAGQIGTGQVIIDERGAQFISGGTAKNPIVLKNQVVMPGFNNCHSHAAQRLLRGLVEQKQPGSEQDDFWSWREKMYAITSSIRPDDFELIATLAYAEMLEAGFTHVGEFHYLHHDHDGRTFPDQLAMSRALVAAADMVGMELSLLPSAYVRHNFNEELKPAQRRFAFTNTESFLDFVKNCHHTFAHTKHHVGAAIHSVRAVPEEWFSPINALAQSLNMPLHVHASEQQSEVKRSLEETGLSPIALLHKHGLLAPTTTLVHAIQLYSGDFELIRDHKPIICLCPSTEKNLGDGIITPLNTLFTKTKICIGTDQHVRFDPLGEALSLEEQERSRLMKRNVHTTPCNFLYQALLPTLHAHGRASLTPYAHDICTSVIALELPAEYTWHGPEAALDAMLLAPMNTKVQLAVTRGEVVVKDGIAIKTEKLRLIQEIKKFFTKIN